MNDNELKRFKTYLISGVIKKDVVGLRLVF